MSRRLPACTRSLALLLLACLLGAPALSAQDARKPARIGRLTPLSAEADAVNVKAFKQGMRELGWVDGMDFTVESRFGDGKREALPGLAADLVKQRVDLILTGSSPGALAARRATHTIPIVIVTTGDPVRATASSRASRVPAGT